MTTSELLERNHPETAAIKTSGRRETLKTSIASAEIRAPARVALLKENFPQSEVHGVLLEYFDCAAKEVFAAGSFNNWQPCATPLVRHSGGTWAVDLMLRPGRYEYRLIVDGRWQEDPLAREFVPNPFGGLNSVLEVKATK